MKKVLLTVTALSGLGLASAMEIQPDMQDQPEAGAYPVAAPSAIDYQKELALSRKIVVICAYFGLNPRTSLISHRSSDVLAMDIVVDDTTPRYNFLKEIYYKKFLPFKDLFGRADLGVAATQEDFATIEEYIKAITTILTHTGAVRNTEIEEARLVVFPSEIFDKIIDQVNRLLDKLIK